MFSTHSCPEGKQIFECPFEVHMMPSIDACEGCDFLVIIDSHDELGGYCAANASDPDDIDTCEALEALDECPEGNTPEICEYQYGGGGCIVGEPISPEDMIKLEDM